MLTGLRTGPVPGLVVGLLLVLLVGLAGCSGSSTPSDSGGGFVGGDGNLTRIDPADREPAPDINGPRLGGGAALSSTDYPDKVVVINVWGSWCGPCRGEAEGLQTASRQTAKIAQFVGLNNRDTGQAQAEAFVRRFGITYPSVYDPSGSQLVKFTDIPPASVPSTVVIDTQGRVAARILGPISETSLVALIRDIEAGK